ncbi:DUF1559 domain-containing protein [bacterium]|nr:DUF1559 domain-containing protein [bacterium]
MTDRIDPLEEMEWPNGPRRHFRFRIRLRSLLWAVAIIGLSISLLMPAMRSAPEAARRAQCVNNLKQIALALHQYQEEYRSLPPAYVAAEDGTPMHSWRVLILPFLDRNDIYEQYRFDEPWDGPNNRKLVDRNPTSYRCPAVRRSRWRFWNEPKTDDTLTSYVVLTGDETPFPASRATKLNEIPDGTSNTMMVVEANREIAVPWTAPRDIAPAEFIRLLNQGKPESDRHSGGMNVAFADGSVRFLRKQTDRKTLEALSTARGGEKIPADAY